MACCVAAISQAIPPEPISFGQGPKEVGSDCQRKGPFRLAESFSGIPGSRLKAFSPHAAGRAGSPSDLISCGGEMNSPLAPKSRDFAPFATGPRYAPSKASPLGPPREPSAAGRVGRGGAAGLILPLPLGEVAEQSEAGEGSLPHETHFVGLSWGPLLILFLAGRK